MEEEVDMKIVDLDWEYINGLIDEEEYIVRLNKLTEIEEE